MAILSGLKGKKVLITGASGGIGRSISCLFAECGATLGIQWMKEENGHSGKNLMVN